jgi:hypothetical protein
MATPLRGAHVVTTLLSKDRVPLLPTRQTALPKILLDPTHLPLHGTPHLSNTMALLSPITPAPPRLAPLRRMCPPPLPRCDNPLPNITPRNTLPHIIANNPTTITRSSHLSALPPLTTKCPTPTTTSPTLNLDNTDTPIPDTHPLLGRTVTVRNRILTRTTAPPPTPPRNHLPTLHSPPSLFLLPPQLPFLANGGLLVRSPSPQIST